MNMYTKRSLQGYHILMYFCNSYASNLNGMRYVVWMSVRHQWNRPLFEVLYFSFAKFENYTLFVLSFNQIL